MKTIAFLSLFLSGVAYSDTLKTAKITQVIQDVRVYRESDGGKAAEVGQTISTGSSIMTGRRSRAELTFQDNTLTRLGQNSVFSFQSGSRDVELKSGSVLLQVPKNAGGAIIRTATVTAAITGTTTMMEYNPGKSVKLLTLEGTQKLYLKGQKDPVSVPAGEMIVMHPDSKTIPKPIKIDLKKLIKTSPLAGDKTFGPLPKQAKDLIQKTLDEQKQAKRTGALLPTNYNVPNPANPIDNTVTDLRPAPTPAPAAAPAAEIDTQIDSAE